MGQRYPELNDSHVRFIEQQHLFFVATAMADGRVNLSPKGMDSLRVLSPSRVLWLNVTGSGNETAVHLQHNPRMTLMFCAFSGKPLILRLYGTACAIHQGEAGWDELASLLPALPGARQLIDMRIDLVQSSCGMSIPFMEYQGEREQLNDWALAKGADGIRQYWQDRNQTSLDGMPSHIVEKSSAPD